MDSAITVKGQATIPKPVREHGLKPSDRVKFFIVVAERAWVLERAYRLRTTEITGAIERLQQADLLVVEHEQQVFTALAALRAGLGAFADALTHALNVRAGSSCTTALDRKALRLPGFVPL